jgi:hypothetical protein
MTKHDQPQSVPAVVDRARFDAALAEQVAVEKEVTRHNGRVSASHRRLPMVELTGAGGALCLAGMRRFSRASHVSGTAVEGLITDGIYRYSRKTAVPGLHPRPDRSGPGPPRRTRTTPHRRAGVTYRRWIPTEEQHLQRLFGATYPTTAAAPTVGSGDRRSGPTPAHGPGDPPQSR